MPPSQRTVKSGFGAPEDAWAQELQHGRVLLTQAGHLPSAGLFPSPTNAGITGSCENEAWLHLAGLSPGYTVTFASAGKVGPGTTSVWLQG